MKPYYYILLLTLFFSLNAYARELPPEVGSGFKAKPVVEAVHYMVVSGDVLASRAGDVMLAKGGNAVDAAIATQLVLNVVEPQASGIGGGGFLLYYDKKKGKMEAYDGRETAPQTASADMFLDSSGAALPYTEALKGGLSVGTPGLLRMLEQVHKDHGKLPWSVLFSPAITLAENGFPLSTRLHRLIESTPYIIQSKEVSALYFTPQNTVKPVGSVIKNPALAETFRMLATRGAKGFYTGKMADDIVKAVQHNAFRPGRLTQKDLAAYHAVKREPLCILYHDYSICTMPPPTSGGITVLQSLKMLEHSDASSLKNPENIHRVMEAARLAFADRNEYVADCDYIPVPVAGMLAPGYIKQRSALISKDHALVQVDAGKLAWDKKCGSIQAATDHPSTTHMSIVDKEGNAVSMTSSIEYSFGSGLMVNGFFLNNELTDFALNPEKNGVKAANRIEPGKRPRSSMAPMLVFNKEGKLYLVVGSPGGSRIISYVLQTLLSVLDNKMPLNDAINQPHFATTGDAIELEENTPITQYLEPLKQMGHKVIIGDLTSGLHGILIKDHRLISGVDMRREGQAVGK